MINKVNFTPSFASTKIRLNNDEASLYMVDKKFLSHVNKYFSLSEIIGGDITPQRMADRIDFDEYIVNVDDGIMTIVGKDGGKGGADTFIGRILTNLYPDRAVFTDDVKPSKLSGEPIELDLEI